MEVAMFACQVCGNTVARAELVSEVFMVEGRRVLVEHIPAQVCQRCGAATFSRETAEKVRQADMLTQWGVPFLGPP